MPNRVIREGLLDSDTFNRLDPAAQMFFVRLMLVVDDYGCADARPEILRSKCYPLSAICPSDVCHMAAQCGAVGLVRFYEAGGKKFLFIPNFNQRTRIKRRRFPNPDEFQQHDGHMTDKRPSHVRVNPNPNPNPNPNTELIHNATSAHENESPNGEGVGEKTTETHPDPRKSLQEAEFAKWWPTYPTRSGKRIGKANSLNVWLREIKTQDFEKIATCTKNYAESGQIPKDPERFLRNRYWLEWMEPATDGSEKKQGYDPGKGFEYIVDLLAKEKADRLKDGTNV